MNVTRFAATDGAAMDGAVRKQHLIDPETCIRCNTCQSRCPTGAISHNADNYVVDTALSWRYVDQPASAATGPRPGCSWR